jgi:hypothetical protein
MLKAGVAKVDITPPVGMWMAGFDERVFPSLAVHVPLWARAVVFDDGETRVGPVALDLIAIAAEGAAAHHAECSSREGLVRDTQQRPCIAFYRK